MKNYKKLLGLLITFCLMIPIAFAGDIETNITLSNPVDLFNFSSSTLTLNYTINYYAVNTSPISANVTIWDSSNVIVYNKSNETDTISSGVLFNVSLSLPTAGTYKWNVYVIENGSTPYSEWASTNKTFTIDLTNPSSSGLSAVRSSQGIYDLSWDNSEVSNYSIDVSTSSSGGGTIYASSDKSTTTKTQRVGSLTDTAIKLYYVLITAFDYSDRSSTTTLSFSTSGLQGGGSSVVSGGGGGIDTISIESPFVDDTGKASSVSEATPPESKPNPIFLWFKSKFKEQSFGVLVIKTAGAIIGLILAPIATILILILSFLFNFGWIWLTAIFIVVMFLTGGGEKIPGLKKGRKGFKMPKIKLF